MPRGAAAVLRRWRDLDGEVDDRAGIAVVPGVRKIDETGRSNFQRHPLNRACRHALLQRKGDAAAGRIARDDDRRIGPLQAEVDDMSDSNGVISGFSYASAGHAKNRKSAAMDRCMRKCTDASNEISTMAA